MEQFLIRNNGPIKGEVKISGAKNSALPILAASILTPQVVTLTNLPAVKDVQTMCQLLEALGLDVEKSHSHVKIDGQGMDASIAPYELVKTMRASILALGPTLARLGHARVSLPGGCAIGARPVDLHIKGLKAMGAEIVLEHGYIDARASQLKGAHIHFDKISVTGTENLMMAATLAKGQTILSNAAIEPEIVDLAQFLLQMGARISGHGTSTITIEGVTSLKGAVHHIMPDRIETGTLLCAAAATCGQVNLRNTQPISLKPVLDALASAGVPIVVEGTSLRVYPHKGLHALNITTQPHPGFPTDMQAQFMPLLSQAEGVSTITESIFENRFMHVPELNRMGAAIRVSDRRAIIQGNTVFSGSQVMATDLRASASLVIAGLIAQGETIVDRIYHLDRGYASLEKKLTMLGADIQRTTSQSLHIMEPEMEIA